MNTDGSSPLSVEKRVDEACDRFEAAWQARQRPRIEDYLPDFASRERSAFLRKLLLVEIELRRSDGENPTPDDYLERFLQDHDLIQSIFASPSTIDNENSSEIPGDGRGPEASHPLPDKIGRYQVRRRLGGGRFGDVYLAYDDVMDREVAVKVPSSWLLETSQAREA